MFSSQHTTMSSRNAVLLAFVVIGAIVNVNAKPPSQLKDGKNADPYDFHWVVGILPDGVSVVSCGGAIIGPRHILTAGHCVYNHPNSFEIRSGANYAHSELALISRVSRYVLHPDYKPLIVGKQLMENDIAILVLEKDLPIDERRSIIDLPTEQVTTQIAAFAGWGVLDNETEADPIILQTANFKVLEDSECAKYGTQPLKPRFICALHPQAYTLSGDSGSPLDAGGKVIGISSSGYRKVGAPDYFTNVYHYVDWIKSVMASK